MIHLGETIYLSLNPCLTLNVNNFLLPGLPFSCIWLSEFVYLYAFGVSLRFLILDFFSFSHL